MNREELIADFYIRHDICLSTDLFGAYFIHDPLCIIESPCFPDPSDLEEWVVKNLKDLERKLV